MQTRRYYLLLATTTMWITSCSNTVQFNNAGANSSNPVNEGSSHAHFNEQVEKLKTSGLIFAGAYSSALTAANSPKNYAGWYRGDVQGQIDRDYFQFKGVTGVPAARHETEIDGAEFRWQDDYQASAKPGPEQGASGGQMRPRIKSIVRAGTLLNQISSGEIWFQYELWIEKGMVDFAISNRWTSQKTARLGDQTVRPHRGNHWTITLDFKKGTQATEWKLRGFNNNSDPTFVKPLVEGAWQRITVRTYDLGTPTPKVDAWHQDIGQPKADKIFSGVKGNWTSETTINQVALMNNSSGHGGTPFPDHDFSVMWRHWIVSTQPIDLGESRIGN